MKIASVVSGPFRSHFSFFPHFHEDPRPLDGGSADVHLPTLSELAGHLHPRGTSGYVFVSRVPFDL